VSFTNQSDMEELDREWIDLCLTAHELGLSKEDIRAFLRNATPLEQNVHFPTAQ
jgi:hypothetical protein